jgi:hypothetical protein
MKTFLYFLYTESLPEVLSPKTGKLTTIPSADSHIMNPHSKEVPNLASMKPLWELLLLAQFFGTEKLVRVCEETLVKKLLTVESVCEMWNTAHVCGANYVARKCLKFLERNFDPPPNPIPPSVSMYYPGSFGDGAQTPVWKTEGWTALDKQLLITLISSDYLTVNSEYSVWEAVVAWARAVLKEQGNSGTTMTTNESSGCINNNRSNESDESTQAKPASESTSESASESSSSSMNIFCDKNVPRNTKITFAVLQTFDEIVQMERILEDIFPHIRFAHIPQYNSRGVASCAFLPESYRSQIAKYHSRVGRPRKVSQPLAYTFV